MTCHRRAALIMSATTFVLALLLACAGGGGGVTPTTAESPSWACPSPTPRSYGEAGPVKEVIRTPLPTAVPTGPESYDEVPVYYEPWEQEYGSLASGPPFPTPTPYAILGTNYAFGQRVRVPPLYAQISARADRLLDAGQQLYYIDITWNNPTTGIIAIDYLQQITLRSVTAANGQVRSGDGWRISAESLTSAGMPPPVGSLPPGETQVQVPIIAPVGTPQVVEFVVERGQVATPVPNATSVAANDDLRDGSAQRLTIQWSNAALAVGPPCTDAGAMTPFQTEAGVAWGQESLPVVAPPGTARVVQLALNQVGKRYVWGATGPESFDCSGLMRWAYSQLSITIPRTADNQRTGLRAVSAGELQPGDLIFFAPPGTRRATHVAMFIGDQDGDGTNDVVHALSPKLGIRVTPNIFGSAFYSGTACKLCMVGFGTAR